MKTKLYMVAEFIFGIMLLGTVGAAERGVISFEDACWQIVVLLIGGLWFLNLLRIEEIREVRRIIK